MKIIKADNTIWYHGTSTDISSFSQDFVGEGHDQEGPGIYFTSEEEDAYGYSKKKNEAIGYVWQCNLQFNKMIPTSGKPNRKELKQLIEWANDFEGSLANWNEDLKIAMNTVLNTFMLETPHQAFLSVWFNFYRYSPVDYVKNMVTLGYDGVIVDRDFNGVKHAIVLNPKIIRNATKVQV